MQISGILYFLCYLQVFPDEEKSISLLFQIKIWVTEKKPSKILLGGVWYNCLWHIYDDG